MYKKILSILSSVPVTIIGGISLVLSFVLSKLSCDIVIDPAWLAVVISGVPLLHLAVKRIIFNKGISKISSALLISIAMIAAILIGDLFAAGEVAFIMAIGEILEDMTTDRAKKGLKRLIDIAPMRARRMNGDTEAMVDASEIKAGDVLRVLPGETIPADGLIILGETSVDQSVMTGESLPADKTVEDEVFCGTVNCYGSFDMKATKASADSSLQKLIKLVKEAEDKKAPMARTADKWASYLVPVALIIAVVTGLITKDIRRAVTVLVVFCPCALVLATPTAIMAAIGQATKRGVIIKSGEALEKTARVDTIVFDKTGTITFGRLEVCGVAVFDSSFNEEEVLSLALTAEERSEHPIGKAITKYASGKGIAPRDYNNFKMSAGKGVSVSSGGNEIVCGNERYILENAIDFDDKIGDFLEESRINGKLAVIVAKNKKCVGVITLSDVLRPDSKDAISNLENLGMTPHMLTGDNNVTAKYFADSVGVKNFTAELLPEQKAEAIQKLSSEGKFVCMVGDGVNDAPSLKISDVGVAMGGVGSDITVDAADIALMNDDLNSLVYLKKLAKTTVRTIKFSIALSMLINIAAVVLSVLGLLGPTAGALVHNAGSCFVVLIAALLYDRKFD